MIENNLIISRDFEKRFFEKKEVKQFSKNFKKVFFEIEKDIDKKDTTLSILSKKFEIDIKLKKLNKLKKYKTIVIIGMGGSILGADAIYNLLKNRIKKKIYFFDNIDNNKIEDFKKKNDLRKVLFLVISKSGNTVETLSNFFSLNVIKRKAKNIIIITEKKDNVLYQISKKFGLFFIEHKNFIGGRYSVLSEVGLVPAYLMGLNIKKMRINLKNVFNKKKKNFLKKSSIRFACLQKKGAYKNLIFLNYAPELEKFIFWCQQLVAESLGKKGKGFLPVVSNCPKDHHSLLQLYLDGPKNNFFNIFSLHSKSSKKLKTKPFSKKINFLNNKNLDNLKIAQKNALINVFKKKGIPYREFSLKTINEKTIGELFSYFILETIIIGKLIKVNPYDQPAVEEVKLVTKKLLS